MNKDVILGLVRHVLTFGGGWFAGHGFIGSSDADAGVAALITLIGIVWSAFDKKPKADTAA